jgi:hypothetical protein
VISPLVASRSKKRGIRGSASITRSTTSASPGTRKANCSASSASVGGRPVAFWCCARNSGTLKKALKSRSTAARSSGDLKTEL